MFPGLYIHVPFCLSKCGYCSFFSVAPPAQRERFCGALEKEMDYYRGRFGAFDTLYIGGGTPSVLSSEEMGRIVKSARDRFDLTRVREATIEANPGDLSDECLARLLALGINRINLGVQSLDNDRLRFLGRRHDAAGALAAFDMARRAGFRNIGIDLMYGIPGQTIEAWIRVLEEIRSLSPEHLSCYELTLEEGTPLGIKVQRGEFRLSDESLGREFFMATSEFLEGAGYVHYEVSNFARGPEYLSLHNRKYWERAPYLGLGPSAHSFLQGKRWWNVRSLEGYLESLEKGKPPLGGEEVLGPEEERLEALFLGLRTRKGIDVADFEGRYGPLFSRDREALIAALEREGLIAFSDGFLHPTRAGLAVADRLSLLGD